MKLKQFASPLDLEERIDAAINARPSGPSTERLTYGNWRTGQREGGWDFLNGLDFKAWTAASCVALTEEEEGPAARREKVNITAQQRWKTNRHRAQVRRNYKRVSADPALAEARRAKKREQYCRKLDREFEAIHGDV